MTTIWRYLLCRTIISYNALTVMLFTTEHVLYTVGDMGHNSWFCEPECVCFPVWWGWLSVCTCVPVWVCFSQGVCWALVGVFQLWESLWVSLSVCECVSVYEFFWFCVIFWFFEDETKSFDYVIHTCAHYSRSDRLFTTLTFFVNTPLPLEIKNTRSICSRIDTHVIEW